MVTDGGGANPRLVRLDTAKEAFIVARLQPQSIFEQSFLITGDGSGPDNPPDHALAASRLGGVSQLAFKVPPTTLSIPYTVAGLLGWAALDNSLADGATGRVRGRRKRRASSTPPSRRHTTS